MTSCVFCEIAKQLAEASVVHRDDLVTAFVDIHPVNPGHTLVVPNRHAPFLGDLDLETGRHMFATAIRIAAAIRASGLRCEGVNLLLSDGEVAGQVVFHTHLHIIPRYSGDGFGFRFGPRYLSLPAREELDSVATRIRSKL